MSLVKEYGSRTYYIGDDYTYHGTEDMWTYSLLAYTKEDIAHVEHLYGCLPKESTPLPVTYCYPELDTSPLLPLDDHGKFQILLGMIQRLVTIGRTYLCTVVSSPNRFGAYPRQYHLDLTIRCFGYIK